MPGMNALLERYEKAGVVGLGFPCNQFDLQEPGRNTEIMNEYMYVRPGNGWTPHDNFHIFFTIDVNGESTHKVYEQMKGACSAYDESLGTRTRYKWEELNARDIQWNYEKFLVDTTGKARYRFDKLTTLEELYPYIDLLLAETPIQPTNDPDFGGV
ncbi:glutathione peroxidase 3-like [Styela clava]|uniref:glutathione peroxidase 3-like n=1 Tax=Styela clava TaxID=7725 RepID=UPI001939BA4C|nr:glutathione peroxidase 3-like [Styela clava]